MPIRQYDFITGIESTAAPTIATPTLGDDLTTKTYVDGLNTAMDLDKAERQFWGDAVADNAALKAVVPGERFDRQVRLSEGGTALYRYDSASVGIDDGDTILEPNDAPVAGRWLKLTTAGGGGGGSGSSAGSNLLQALMNDEADSVIAVNPNVISDDFGDEDKGTKVNIIQSASALVFPSGQTTGTYERISESSVDLATFDSVMVASLRAGSPNATAWAPSATDTSPDIVFSGDLTGIFGTGSVVCIYKQATVDGVLKQIFLSNSSNEIAQLEVLGAVYSSGPNTTTVTIDNPSALDLSMGLSAANFPDNLRIAPFDVVVKSRANTGEALTAATIEDAAIFEPRTIKISGESLAAAITDAGLTGSAITVHPTRSLNGQYYIVKVTEQAAGSVVFHWFYSIDKGKTWTKYSSTRNQGVATTQTEEFSGAQSFGNPNQTIIANNGKWFSIYNSYDGSRTSTKGVYGDISVGSPTFNDTPGIANDGDNFNSSNSSVTGFIFSRTGTEDSAPVHVTGDLTDLSFVVAIAINGNHNIAMMQQFTAGGATAGVRNTTVTNASSFANGLIKAGVSGTAPNHRYFVYMFTVASTCQWKYWDEGVSGAAITTVDPMPAPLSSTAIFGAAVNPTSHKGYGLHTSSVTGYTSFTNSSTPGFLSRQLFHTGISLYSGFNELQNRALVRTSAHRVIIDPANDNHVFFAWEFLNQVSSNGGRTALLAEIYDNDFVGEAIVHSTLNAVYPLRSTSATTQIGQTFTTAGATRIRTLILYAHQVLDIPYGNTITVTIQATTAGVPNGTVLATSVNTYDPRKMYRGGEHMYLFFNFNSLSLSGATQYAFVITSTAPISATNYTNFVGDSSNSYAGGSQVVFNGTTWGTVANDLAFRIHGEYLYDMSNGDVDANLSFSWRNNDTSHADEHQIEKSSTSSTTLISTYRLTASGDGSRWPNSGNIRRIPVTMSGSSATVSTIGTRATTGYASGNYDEFLVLSVAPGTTACSRLTFNNGAISASQKSEDRAGPMAVINSYETPVYVSDSDFQEGVAAEFDGAGSKCWYYNNYQMFHMRSVTPKMPFAIEMEIKGPYAAGQLAMIWHESAGTGWWWRLESGFMTFQCGAQTVKASDMTEPTTYHKIRFVYDGTIGRLYRTTGAPHTTFTEVGGYSTQNITTLTGDPGVVLAVGNTSANALKFVGRIGYIKISKGWSTLGNPFAYDGWKDQGAKIHHVNLGDLITAKAALGQNASSTNVQYARFNTLDQNAAANSLKDVYASTFMLTRSMTAGKVPDLKIEWSRVGNQDSSRIEGIIGEYSK